MLTPLTGWPKATVSDNNSGTGNDISFFFEHNIPMGWEILTLPIHLHCLQRHDSCRTFDGLVARPQGLEKMSQKTTAQVTHPLKQKGWTWWIFGRTSKQCVLRRELQSHFCVQPGSKKSLSGTPRLGRCLFGSPSQQKWPSWAKAVHSLVAWVITTVPSHVSGMFRWDVDQDQIEVRPQTWKVTGGD